MEILRLPIKKKFFDLIAADVKKEEYRELKPHWGKRICSHWCKAVKSKCEPPFKKFDAVEFINGYNKNSPRMLVKCLGVKKGRAVPEWSDNWVGEVFVIKLGEILISPTTDYELAKDRWILRYVI